MHPVFYSTRWQRSLLPLAWKEDTSVLCCTRCCSMLSTAGNSTRAQYWKPDFCTGATSCLYSPPSKPRPPCPLITPISHHCLSSHLHFFPHSLQRLEGRSFTCCRQTRELGSVRVQRKYRNSKWLWLKIYSSKKERSVLVFGNDRAQFSYFCREDYTHQGRAILTWEFLYRYIFEEAASGINSTHYQGTDR